MEQKEFETRLKILLRGCKTKTGVNYGYAHLLSNAFTHTYNTIIKFHENGLELFSVLLASTSLASELINYEYKQDLNQFKDELFNFYLAGVKE